MNVKTIGETLRTERVRRGLNLEEISKETKISKGILNAMEHDQFASIPGGAYRLNFLRQYARLVGLDEEEIVSSFRQQYGVQSEPLTDMAQKPESRNAAAWLWALVLLSALLGVYEVSERNRDGGDADRAPVAPTKPVDLPTQSQHDGSTNPIHTTTSAVHVEFTAIEPVWVSVQCDGALSYTGTLFGPESKPFEASRVVTVLVGNAGGLVIVLNGRQIGPLGKHGETQLLEIEASGPRRVPRHPTDPAPSVAAPRAF